MLDGIQQFLDNCPERQGIDKSVRIMWSRPGVGFGEIYFYYDTEGNLRCENETMSKEFVKDVLCALVDQAEFDDG